MVEVKISLSDQSVSPCSVGNLNVFKSCGHLQIISCIYCLFLIVNYIGCIKKIISDISGGGGED